MPGGLKYVSVSGGKLYGVNSKDHIWYSPGNKYPISDKRSNNIFLISTERLHKAQRLAPRPNVDYFRNFRRYWPSSIPTKCNFCVIEKCFTSFAGAAPFYVPRLARPGKPHVRSSPGPATFSCLQMLHRISAYSWRFVSVASPRHGAQNSCPQTWSLYSGLVSMQIGHSPSPEADIGPICSCAKSAQFAPHVPRWTLKHHLGAGAPQGAHFSMVQVPHPLVGQFAYPTPRTSCSRWLHTHVSCGWSSSSESEAGS